MLITDFNEIRLSGTSHPRQEDGLCFMEAVAWFAGEEHGHEPDCACRVLGSYSIRLNDAMPDDVRNRLLKPLVPMLVGTRDGDSEVKRAEFLAKWAAGMCEGNPDAANCARLASDYAADNSINSARCAANVAAYTGNVWETAVEGLRQAILIGRHEAVEPAELVA